MSVKVLATYGTLELQQHLTSGDVWVHDTATRSSSVALDHTEVKAIIADPSLMAMPDLEPDTDQAVSLSREI